MAENSSSKSLLILALASSLAAALVAVVVKVSQDDELRDRLGDTYYIMGLAIIGCMLLVLAV